MKEFVKQLGFWDLLALVVAGIAGAGAFLMILLLSYRNYLIKKEGK